jgi:hypothetical protein
MKDQIPRHDIALVRHQIIASYVQASSPAPSLWLAADDTSLAEPSGFPLLYFLVGPTNIPRAPKLAANMMVPV